MTLSTFMFIDLYTIFLGSLIKPMYDVNCNQTIELTYETQALKVHVTQPKSQNDPIFLSYLW